jgi:hypothetical protein
MRDEQRFLVPLPPPPPRPPPDTQRSKGEHRANGYLPGSRHVEHHHHVRRRHQPRRLLQVQQHVWERGKWGQQGWT